MLNNEFRLIGTVISDFEQGGSENFVKYYLTIEVERKKKNYPSTFKTIIYESNKSIAVTETLKGKQVIAQGYLDEYKGNTQLILQDIIVIGAVPEEVKMENAPLNNVADDDLPF